MKFQLFILALPLALCVAGCNKESSSTANSTDTESATNMTAKDVDNTRQNTRDREHAAVTPSDQSDSAADRELTQKIRQACMSGTNNFSTEAQNIKVVTTNGKVTLRGPVDTEAEKTHIEMIAKNIAGAGNVEDDLEVKTR
jgi:hyperosmotically inducible periplasmic protein